jgi:hypothetical protein
MTAVFLFFISNTFSGWDVTIITFPIRNLFTQHLFSTNEGIGQAHYKYHMAEARSATRRS